MKQIKGLTKAEVKKLRTYAGQLHRQCENACNGMGNIPFKGRFYAGAIDDWVRREYGHDIKSAYINNDYEETVFDIEIEKLEKKIEDITSRIQNSKVVFQHDPRGWEVKLFVDDVNISELLY